MSPAPLVITFAPGTTLYRERDRVSPLPIVGNGPPGTFVVYADGLRVSLPTDQIVSSDDTTGAARVGFGGMHFTGISDGQLTFARVREVLPEAQLSPVRSHVMRLEITWVATVVDDGRLVWPEVAR